MYMYIDTKTFARHLPHIVSSAYSHQEAVPRTNKPGTWDSLGFLFGQYTMMPRWSLSGWCLLPSTTQFFLHFFLNPGLKMAISLPSTLLSTNMEPNSRGSLLKESSLPGPISQVPCCWTGGLRGDALDLSPF